MTFQVVRKDLSFAIPKLEYYFYLFAYFREADKSNTSTKNHTIIIATVRIFLKNFESVR